MAQTYSKPPPKALSTLVGAAVLAFLLAQTHAGFMLVFVAPIVAIWFVYAGYLAVKYPAIRETQVLRMTIWVVALFLILWVHLFRHAVTRSHANRIVAAVEQYERKHERYPMDSAAMGWSDVQIKSLLGVPGGYSYQEGKPSLFYAVTYIVYDTYHYDFALKTWIFDN
jgi:hypothetical protein